MRDVRWREDGFEGKCEICTAWLPLTLEFWNKRWLSRCKVCIRARKAAGMRDVRKDEERRLAANEKRRIYRRLTRDAHLAYQRAWRDANRERVNEWARNWRAKNAEKVRESARRYYAETRDYQREQQRIRRDDRRMEKAA